MTSRKSRFLAPLVATLTLGFSVGASAMPITGAIGFGGAFAPTGGTDLSDATGINFLTAFVLAGNGTFAGIPSFTGASFTDFTFDPFAAAVEPLWTVSAGGVDYSFDLEGISVDFQSDTQINLSGTGTLMATGFDNTAGEWVFSGDATGVIVFTFSSITGAVPEPGTLALLGLGALGFVAARRRRTTQ